MTSRRLLIALAFALLYASVSAQDPPPTPYREGGLVAHLAAEAERLTTAGATELVATLPPHDWRALLAARGLPSVTPEVAVGGVVVRPQAEAGPYVEWRYRYWARGW